MRKFLQIGACMAMWAAAQPAYAANRISCQLHEDLSGLHTSAARFLEHISTGAHSGAREKLRAQLDALSEDFLKRELEDAGLTRLTATFLSYIRMQERLVQQYDIAPPKKANDLAQRLSAHDATKRVRREVEKLGCKGEGGAVDGHSTGLPGGTASNLGRRVEPKEAAAMSVAAIALIFIVIVSIERIAQRHRRRAKRFPCATACWVVPLGELRTGQRAEQASFVDVSQLGGKIRIEHSFAPEDSIQILVGDQTLEAYVVWCNADYVGVKFGARLTEAELMLIRSSQKTAAKSA